MKSSCLALGLLALTLIGGCAVKGNVTVIEPTDGPRARIRVAALDEGPMRAYRGVRAYPGSQCIAQDIPGNGNVVNPSLGFEKTLNDQHRGMPSTVNSQDGDLRKAEIYATANQPIALKYFRAASQSVSVAAGVQTTTTYRDYCAHSVQFIPEAGADYEIVFDAARSCGVLAYQLVQTDGQVAAIPMKIQDAPACRVK